MNPVPRPQPEPASQSVSQEAGLSSLPVAKQIHVGNLLGAIGSDADNGTEFILGALARRLPEASLARVLESVMANRTRVQNRAKYVVGALQSEFAEMAARR